MSVEGSADEVLFEVIDRLCLGRNGAFNQITDRESSDHLSSFYDRQMPHPLFGHDSHAIDHRVGQICEPAATTNLQTPAARRSVSGP